MRFLKNSLIIILLAIITYNAVACGEEEKAQTIKFGVLPVVDTLPLQVALDEGFFKEENVNLEIISFSSALERDAALQAGKINGYFGDLLNTIVMINTGVDTAVITVSYRANADDRMFAILASPDSGLTDLSQLKGGEVGISSATIIEYLLDSILSEHGFSEQDVKKQEVKQMPIRLQMLLGNEITAALLPEPLVTLAESKGAKVLADDRVLDGTLTILALSNDMMRADKTLAGRFLRAYDRAVNVINEDPEAFRGLLVAKTRIPPDVEGQYVIPVFPLASAPPVEDVTEVQNWLLQKGIIQESIPYDKVVVSPRLVPSR